MSSIPVLNSLSKIHVIPKGVQQSNNKIALLAHNDRILSEVADIDSKLANEQIQHAVVSYKFIEGQVDEFELLRYL